MTPEQKAALDKAALEADTVTDWSLGKVAASRWSWLIVLLCLLAAFGLGWWSGRA